MEKISLDMLAVPVTRFPAEDLMEFVRGHSIITHESINPSIEQDYRIADYVRQRFPNLKYLEFFKRASDFAPYRFAKLVRGDPLLGIIMEVYLSNNKGELEENLQRVNQTGISLALTPLGAWRDNENQPIELSYRPYGFGENKAFHRTIDGIKGITMTDYLFLELNPLLALRDDDETVGERLLSMIKDVEERLPSLKRIVGNSLKGRIMPPSRLEPQFGCAVPPYEEEAFGAGQKTEGYTIL